MRINQLFLSSIVCLMVLISCKNESTLQDSSPLLDSFDVRNDNRIKGNQTAENIVFDYLPAATSNQIIRHDYYTLSYNEDAEQAEWLAYELKKSYIINNDFKRPYFIEDPKVKSESADWRNYKRSGYDKGHLCPAGDMEFSKSAYDDTFYTSNISPQNHDFNGGIWNRLEQKVRYWAQRYDGVYVVTGGVLKNTSKTIGTEKVVVPDFFYKIILDDSEGKYKMIAFLVPNEKSNKPLYDFVVAVDSIEKITGIDFFPQLEDSVEKNLEKNNSIKSWVFN